MLLNKSIKVNNKDELISNYIKIISVLSDTNITNREREVLVILIQQPIYKLKYNITNTAIRKKIKEELKLSTTALGNLLHKLKEKGILTEESINPVFQIPFDKEIKFNIKYYTDDQK